MRRITPNTTKSLLTFHQWRGKGYAVFASLGKQIRIGKLAISIAQSLIAKVETQNRFNLQPAHEDEDDSLFSEEQEQELLLALSPLVQFSLYTTNAIQSGAKLYPALSNYNLIIHLRSVFCFVQGTDFLFYNHA